jgi:hypothetical protein
MVAFDEREIVIDRAADRLAYIVLAFGLLVDVAYRSFFRAEASWDLLGLIVLSGLVGLAYRLRFGVRARPVLTIMVVAALVGFTVAVAIALVRPSL